jgi:hypothetical protein
MSAAPERAPLQRFADVPSDRQSGPGVQRRHGTPDVNEKRG